MNFSCSLNLSFLATISNQMANRPLLQYYSYAFFPLSLHSKLLSSPSLSLQKIFLQQFLPSFFIPLLHFLMPVKKDCFIRYVPIYVQPQFFVHYSYFIEQFWTHFSLLVYFRSFYLPLVYPIKLFFGTHEHFPYQFFCCLFFPAFWVLLPMHSISPNQTHWNVGMA